MVSVVTLTWIPSHVNIRGNEEADKLAKEGLNSPSIDLNISFEQKEILEEIDKFVLGKWQSQWSTSATGKFYKGIVPEVSGKVKYININRKKEVTLTRLRLGQCKLNKYLFNIKRHDTGLCDICRVDETVEHYLLHCEIKDKVKTVCQDLGIPVSIDRVLNSAAALDKIYPEIKRSL
jgi:hypothetical protein